MTPFLVKADLCSPVILGRRLTLDAILAAMIFERTGDVDASLRDIPLKKLGETWCGSQAYIDASVSSRRINICGALRADFDLTPSIVRPNLGRKEFPAVYNNKGDYQNSFSEYASFDAPSVWFSGTGDIDAVRSLLADMVGIGAKRSVGYGQIVRVHVRETTGDKQGLVLSDGTPARPIPVADWATISNKRALLAAERFKPPYWNGESVLCAVPNPTSGNITPRFF